MAKYLLRGSYGILILLVASAFAFKVFQPIKVLPRIRLAPAFDMTDQDMLRVTSEDLRGQVVLYTFTYLNCERPCYNIDQTMQEVQSRLDETRIGQTRLTMITISFDPQHDSPNALLNRARILNADTNNWRFMTTTNETMLKTVIGSGFQTYFEKKEAGTFSFDPVFVLVDGWGVVRAEYRYQTEVSTADRILRHLSVLAEEVNNSTGPTKLAYEAAHLFLCYAP